MKRQSLDARFEEDIDLKAFRRGAANAANGMRLDTALWLFVVLT